MDEHPKQYILWVLMIAAVLLVLHYYPRLPDPVASHFSMDGKPDGWSSKFEFHVVYFAIFAFLAAVFLSLGRILPKIPNQWINLPRKDYWLDERRRDETMAWIRSHMVLFADGVMALMLAGYWLTAEQNLGRSTMQHMVWVLAIFMAFAGIFLYFMMKHFVVPETGNPENPIRG